MTPLSVATTSDASPRLRGWLLWALWVALTVALALSLPSLPWENAFRHVRQVSAGWLTVAVVANLSILVFWTAEWRLLAPVSASVPFSRMFEVVATTAAVLNSVPFFAGEASALALLMQRGGLSNGAAVSVLALDQLLVGLTKLGVVAAAAAYAPLPRQLLAGLSALALGVAALALILLPVAHRWSIFRTRLLARPSALAQIAARVVALGAHLDAVRDWRRGRRAVLLSLAKKGAELAAIIGVQVAFGFEPWLGAGLLVLAALAVATMLPVTPGNVGVYEATVFATYRFAGVPPDAALGMAVVQHLVFLLPMLLTGYFTLTFRQLRSSRP